MLAYWSAEVDIGLPSCSCQLLHHVASAPGTGLHYNVTQGHVSATAV